MADTLTSRFTKRFPGGPVIHCELNRPLAGHSVTVLFGPSGCGKTTVLRCLAGLERPEEGGIQFGAETWFDAQQNLCLAPQQRGIGFVFQDYALFPHLTVEANIGYALRVLSPAERQGRVCKMLDQFGLADVAQQRPRQLSGGQQQRVALARTLVHRPRLLLLDEPLSALDTPTRQRLRGELRALLCQCEIPTLLVTHDRQEALALGDYLVVMHEGRMVQQGPVHEVFSRPSSLAVAGILAVETIRLGRVVDMADGLVIVAVGDARLTALGQDLPTGTSEVFVCIRAEDVILTQGEEGQSSPRNRLAATVCALTREGPMVRVDLDCGFPLAALLTKQGCEAMALREGARVHALVKAPHIHLIPHAV